MSEEKKEHEDIFEDSDTEHETGEETLEEHIHLPDDPSVLQTRIIELETELAEMRDKAARVLAEADNIRKRAERNAEDSQRFAIAKFAKDLLEVADNLRRAMEAVPEEKRGEDELIKNLFIGIDATAQSLHKTFEKNGIRQVAPAKGRFDPNLHEVMFEAEIEGKSAGEIIQLIEPGYSLNDRLLRPARVGVAKGTSQPEVDEKV